MKKLFCLLLMSMICNVYADCPPERDKSTCPVRECPTGTFMGDDGKCYACDERKDIYISCIGWEEIHRLCPLRIWFGSGTSTLSKFCPTNNCPKGTLMGDNGECYTCDERKDISVMCMGEGKASELCPNRVAFRSRTRFCPKNTCQKGFFMGDDGKCYSCDERESIPAACFKYDLPELCPNRIYDTFMNESKLLPGFQPRSIADYYPGYSDC